MKTAQSTIQLETDTDKQQKFDTNTPTFMIFTANFM